jgi:hypothetical protein
MNASRRIDKPDITGRNPEESRRLARVVRFKGNATQRLAKPNADLEKQGLGPTAKSHPKLLLARSYDADRQPGRPKSNGRHKTAVEWATPSLTPAATAAASIPVVPVSTNTSGLVSPTAVLNRRTLTQNNRKGYAQNRLDTSQSKK